MRREEGEWGWRVEGGGRKEAKRRGEGRRKEEGGGRREAGRRERILITVQMCSGV